MKGRRGHRLLAAPSPRRLQPPKMIPSPRTLPTSPCCGPRRASQATLPSGPTRCGGRPAMPTACSSPPAARHPPTTAATAGGRTAAGVWAGEPSRGVGNRRDQGAPVAPCGGGSTGSRSARRRKGACSRRRRGRRLEGGGGWMEVGPARRKRAATTGRGVGGRDRASHRKAGWDVRAGPCRLQRQQGEERAAAMVRSSSGLGHTAAGQTAEALGQAAAAAADGGERRGGGAGDGGGGEGGGRSTT